MIKVHSSCQIWRPQYASARMHTVLLSVLICGHPTGPHPCIYTSKQKPSPFFIPLFVHRNGTLVLLHHLWEVFVDLCVFSVRSSGVCVGSNARLDQEPDDCFDGRPGQTRPARHKLLSPMMSGGQKKIRQCHSTETDDTQQEAAAKSVSSHDPADSP